MTKLQATHPDNRLINRALATYTAYSIRWDPLAEVRAMLPPDLKVIGMVAGPDDLIFPSGVRSAVAASPTLGRMKTASSNQNPPCNTLIVSDLHLQNEKVAP